LDLYSNFGDVPKKDKVIVKEKCSQKEFNFNGLASSRKLFT